MKRKLKAGEKPELDGASSLRSQGERSTPEIKDHVESKTYAYNIDRENLESDTHEQEEVKERHSGPQFEIASKGRRQESREHAKHLATCWQPKKTKFTKKWQLVWGAILRPLKRFCKAWDWKI